VYKLGNAVENIFGVGRVVKVFDEFVVNISLGKLKKVTDAFLQYSKQSSAHQTFANTGTMKTNRRKIPFEIGTRVQAFYFCQFGCQIGFLSKGSSSANVPKYRGFP
jgi:hypothetical protein